MHIFCFWVICHNQTIILQAFLCALKDSLGHVAIRGDLFGAFVEATFKIPVDFVNELIAAFFDASGLFSSALFGDCLWRA